MFRKLIVAAVFMASFAAIAPSAALAQDRGHGGWQGQRGYSQDHGNRRIHQSRRDEHRYNRGSGYQSNRGHGNSNRSHYVKRGGRAYDHDRRYTNNH